MTIWKLPLMWKAYYGQFRTIWLQPSMKWREVP
jgi:hypothetical protein